MTVHAAVMNTSASTDCKDDGGISEVSEDSDTSQDAVATSAGMGPELGTSTCKVVQAKRIVAARGIRNSATL